MWEKLMVGKSYLVRFVRQTQVVSDGKSFSSGKGGHFYKWKFVTFMR